MQRTKSFKRTDVARRPTTPSATPLSWTQVGESIKIQWSPTSVEVPAFVFFADPVIGAYVHRVEHPPRAVVRYRADDPVDVGIHALLARENVHIHRYATKLFDQLLDSRLAGIHDQIEQRVREGVTTELERRRQTARSELSVAANALENVSERAKAMAKMPLEEALTHVDLTELFGE